MAKVEIYTTPLCPYCSAAKSLLKSRGADFEEFDVSGNRELRGTMSRRAGGATSVPQIFIDDSHIGGFDDMAELDADGGLAPLLAK